MGNKRGKYILNMFPGFLEEDIIPPHPPTPHTHTHIYVHILDCLTTSTDVDYVERAIRSLKFVANTVNEKWIACNIILKMGPATVPSVVPANSTKKQKAIVNAAPITNTNTISDK